MALTSSLPVEVVKDDDLLQEIQLHFPLNSLLKFETCC